MNVRRTAAMGWILFALFVPFTVLGPCLSSNALPSTLSDDPDLDGLTNQQEYNYGTDPYDSDSDDGGENDGSEIDFGQDPLNPADDEVEALTWIQAQALNNAIEVSFDVKTEYSGMVLYRADGRNADFIVVNWNIPPVGAYTDGGLVNGTTYYYRMKAIDSHGHGSEISFTVFASPSPFAIFSDGFESGNETRWSTSVP